MEFNLKSSEVLQWDNRKYSKFQDLTARKLLLINFIFKWISNCGGVLQNRREIITRNDAESCSTEPYLVQVTTYTHMTSYLYLDNIGTFLRYMNIGTFMYI